MPSKKYTKHLKGNSEFVKNLPIVDGQIIFNTETGELFTDDIDKRIPMGSNMSGEPKYGVRFDTSANSGSTVHRLHQAVDAIAGVGTDTEKVRNDFDSFYPWSGMRRACGKIQTNGEFRVNAYIGEPGYAKDGSNGEVFVECPLFWYKHYYKDAAEIVEISPVERSGYLPAPTASRQGKDGNPARKMYFSAYRMATIDGIVTSRSGVFSDMISLNNGMTNCAKTGTHISLETWEDAYTIWLLMVVEFATRDLQTVMRGLSNMAWSGFKAAIAESGVNRVILTDSNAGYFTTGSSICIASRYDERLVTNIEVFAPGQKAVYFDGEVVNTTTDTEIFCTAAKNGSCDGVLSSSGSPVSNTDGKHDCVYRGIETPYGSAYSWISNLLFKRVGAGTPEDPYAYDVYYLPDLSKYAGGKITDDYVKLNYRLPVADGYGKKLGYDARYPHIRFISEIGGSSVANYADYYQYPRYDICACRRGGYWSDGSAVGPLSLGCNYAPASSNVRSRARLSIYR